MRSPRSTSLARRAFTLVEVTLALGVASVAILSMLALMPVGLATMKDAADSTGRAQVLVQVASALKVTPFGDLATYVDAHPANAPLLFDRSGRPAGSIDEATFGASLSLPSDAYPGAPQGLTNSALAVGITIAKLKPGTSEVLSSQKTVLIIPKS
jgi:uncharacterized protein (TIGR02598 family)